MNSERTPWIVSGVAVLVAAGLGAQLWRSAPAEPPAPSAAACDCDEIPKLRRQLALMDAERVGLLQELDRMRQFVSGRKEFDAQTAEFQDLPEEERRKRLSHALARLKDLSPILHEGRPETFKELQGIFQVMMLAPPDDSAPFRDLWNESEDETMRSMLVMHIVSREGAASLPFLKEEMARTDDEMLRHRLLEHLPLVSDLESDAEARQLLLATMNDESVPEDTRQLAIQQLAGVSSPEVQEALLAVAGGKDEEAVRERAIRALAANPETRAQLLEVVAEEQSPRLRTLAECTAKLSELEGGG